MIYIYTHDLFIEQRTLLLTKKNYFEYLCFILKESAIPFFTEETACNA